MVLYEVISKRSSVTEGSLTVNDINEVLDDLCKNMGKQLVAILFIQTAVHFLLNREVQARLMQHVYNKTTPEEQRWIARIILKGLVSSY